MPRSYIQLPLGHIPFPDLEYIVFEPCREIFPALDDCKKPAGAQGAERLAAGVQPDDGILVGVMVLPVLGPRRLGGFPPRCGSRERVLAIPDGHLHG